MQLDDYDQRYTETTQKEFYLQRTNDLLEQIERLKRIDAQSIMMVVTSYVRKFAVKSTKSGRFSGWKNEERETHFLEGNT